MRQSQLAAVEAAAEGPDIGMAIFLFFGVIILTLLPALTLHGLVKDEALQGYSKSHIKKLKQALPFWDRSFLIYLAGRSNTPAVRRGVFLYWLYWIASLVMAIMTALTALGAIDRRIVYYFFVLWMWINTAIYLVWRRSEDRNERER